jgi:hypothetical protein
VEDDEIVLRAQERAEAPQMTELLN